MKKKNLEQKVDKPLEDKKEKKGFWDKLWNKKKIDKKGMYAVLFLKENGTAEEYEMKAHNGFFVLDGNNYHEHEDCIYRLSKDRIPLVLIRQGEILPIGSKRWEEKTIQQKCLILQDHVMKGIRHAERVRSGEKRDGTKITGKAWVGIGVIVIVVLGFLMQYIS